MAQREKGRWRCGEPLYPRSSAFRGLPRPCSSQLVPRDGEPHHGLSFSEGDSGHFPSRRFSLARVHSQSRKDQVARPVKTQAQSGDTEW